MPEPQNNTPEGCRCPECGSELPDNLPPDLCPKCLLNACLTAQPETGPIGTTLVSADGRSRGLPQPGEQLGHYLIVRSLGGGGMGTVFEAEEVETGRRVALKVLSHALDSPQARERFIREGRLAGSINHPNSVYVFGTEELGGTPAIAMELVAGGTLEDRVRTCGPMPRPRPSMPCSRLSRGLRQRIASASCTATSSPRTVSSMLTARSRSATSAFPFPPPCAWNRP